MPCKIFLQFGKDGNPTAPLLGCMVNHQTRRDFAVVLALVCRQALSCWRRSCSVWERTLRPRAFGLPSVSHYGSELRTATSDMISKGNTPLTSHKTVIVTLPADTTAVLVVFTCLSFKNFNFCSQKLYALHGFSRADIFSLHSAMYKSIIQSHLTVEV